MDWVVQRTLRVTQLCNTNNGRLQQLWRGPAALKSQERAATQTHPCWTKREMPILSYSSIPARVCVRVCASEGENRHKRGGGGGAWMAQTANCDNPITLLAKPHGTTIKGHLKKPARSKLTLSRLCVGQRTLFEVVLVSPCKGNIYINKIQAGHSELVGFYLAVWVYLILWLMSVDWMHYFYFVNKNQSNSQRYIYIFF